MLPAARKALYNKLKGEIFQKLGDKCCTCGYSDTRALQIDHVNSDGARDRKNYSGSSYLYKILKHIEDGAYQLLCANCNWIKRHENKEVADRYPEGYVFPTEEPHVKVFKKKKCGSCRAKFVPTNGRQLRCFSCVKG